MQQRRQNNFFLLSLLVSGIGYIYAQSTVQVDDAVPNVPGPIPATIGASSVIVTNYDNVYTEYMVTGGRTSSALSAKGFRYTDDVNPIVPLPDLPTPLAGHSSTYYRGYVVIFGGETNTGLVSNTLYIANTIDYQFKPIPLTHIKGTLPSPRAYHTAQVYPRIDPLTNRTETIMLVIYGGIGNEGLPLSDTWIAIIEKDDSSMMEDTFVITYVKPTEANTGTFPRARFSHASTISNQHHLYIHGGRTNVNSIHNPNDILSDLWYLDLSNGFRWSQVTLNGASTTVQRFGHILFGRWHSTSNAETSIGVYGGYGGSNTDTFLFTIATNAWTTYTLSPNSTSIFTAPLYATGAYDVDTDTVYTYGGYNFTGSLPNATFFTNPTIGLAYTGLTGITSTSVINPKIQLLTLSPSLTPEVIHCQVSSWSDWSPCMSELSNDYVLRDNGFCRESKRYRSRYIVIPPSGGGNDCPTLIESVRCGPRPCRVDSTVRWAGFEEREDINDAFDMTMIGQSSSTENGAFVYVGSYLQYSYRDGTAYPMQGLTPPANLVLTCNADPPSFYNTTTNTSSIPDTIVSHSYMNFRSIDIGGYVFGTIALQGTGTDNATTVAASPNVTTTTNGTVYTVAMGGHYIGNISGTVGETMMNLTSSSTVHADIYIMVFYVTYNRLTDDDVFPVVSTFHPSIMWMTAISGRGRKEVKKIRYTEDARGLMVAGQFTHNITFPNSPCGTLVNRETNTTLASTTMDSFIARFNAMNGTCEWVVYIGGNGTQTVSSISVVGSTVFAVGTSVSRYMEVSRVNMPATYRLLNHPYSNGNLMTPLLTRTNGYLVALSVNNGSITIASLLMAMNDTSNIIPTSVIATSSYAGALANGFIITVGGMYNGQASLSLSNSSRLNIPSALITSTGRVNTTVGNSTILTNAYEGFVVRYDWKIGGINTILWRTIATANNGNVHLSAMTEAPATLTVPFASYNGTVHTVFSTDNSLNTNLNVSTFTLSMRNPVLSGTTSAMYFGMSGRNGAPLYSQAIGSSTHGSVTITSAIATDRQILYMGNVHNSLGGLNLTPNTTATTQGLASLSIPSAPLIQNNTVSMFDVFAVSVTSFEPFAPSNCIVSDWSAWTDCPRNCSSVARVRTRTVTSPAVYGGVCTEPLLEQRFDCANMLSPFPMPCLGSKSYWNITMDTLFNDDVATIATSPDNDLFMVPSMRIRNETNVTRSGVFRLVPTFVNSFGTNVWSATIDNVTAPDMGLAFTSPITSSLVTPQGMVTEPLVIMGGTVKQSLPLGFGSPLNPVGNGIVTVHSAANGKLLASLAFGSADANVPPAYGLAVAYSPLYDTVYVAGRYMQNITVRINTTTSVREHTYDQYSTFANRSTALISSFSLHPLFSNFSWTIGLPSVDGISTTVTSLTASKDGSILYILGIATRTLTGPVTLSMTFTPPMPPFDPMNGGNVTEMPLPITIDIMNLINADREYLFFMAVEALTGIYLSSQAIFDIGPSIPSASMNMGSPTLTGVGPVPETLDNVPDTNAHPGSKAFVTIGDNPSMLIMATTYSSTQMQFFGGSMIPPCNYNNNTGTCVLVGKLDGISGTPILGSLIYPSVMDNTVAGHVRVTGVSSNAGLIAVTGTFTTPNVKVSEQWTAKIGSVAYNNSYLGMRNNINPVSDVFVALYHAELFGLPEISVLSLWTSNSTSPVTNPSVVISPNGRSIYVATSVLDRYNNTVWTRKAITYAFEGPGMQCHSVCRTCSSSSPFACTTCRPGLFLVNGTCIDECPIGFYPDTATGGCSRCHSACLTCSGPTSTDCTSCATQPNATETKLLFMNSCVADCSILNQDFGNCFGSNKCVSKVLADYNPGTLCNCHSSCYTCAGPAATQCTSCPPSSLLYINVTAGTTTCISPNACYLAAGYARYDNVTGQAICLPYVCPSALVPIYSTVEIIDKLTNLTINATTEMNITLDYFYNITAEACQSIPSATPTPTSSPSATSTPSPSATVSTSSTAVPSPSPVDLNSPSPTPVYYPVNCTLSATWSNWSSTCPAMCAMADFTTPNLRIFRTKTIVNASVYGGYCPSEFSPERYEFISCICPSPSRTPLPSPVSTCYNNKLDPYESDIDCGGDLGCPRCLAGRRCYKTLDCIGDASPETLAFLQRYNYTGQPFVCSQPTGSSTTDSNDKRGVCTDARLSLSTYGTSSSTTTNNGTNVTSPTVSVPKFVEFKYGFVNVPTKAPINFLINWIRQAVWSVLNMTNPALTATLTPDFIVVANVNITFVPVERNSTGDNSTNSTFDPSVSPSSSPGNGTAGANASATASSSASPSASPSTSADPSDNSNSTSGSNSTSIDNGNSTDTGNSTSMGNSTGTNTTVPVRRILNVPVAAPSLSRLRNNIYRSSNRYLADATIDTMPVVTFTIRVIIPEEVNSTDALTALTVSAATAPTYLVNSLVDAIVAGNYTDPGVPLSVTATLVPTGDPVNGTVSLFSIVEPLPPLVEITAVNPGIVPVTPTEDTGSGGTAGGAAGGIIVGVFVIFFGIAFYYVRKTGSFLGCTFGPLADCFGFWPLSEYAERNRQALKNKDIWSTQNGNPKDPQIFLSPLAGKKKVLTTDDNNNVCPPVDINEIMASHSVMNPVHHNMGQSSRRGGSAHFNVTYDNFDGTMNNGSSSNNNRQNFAPLGMANNGMNTMGMSINNMNTMGMPMNAPMTMGMQINMVQQQQQQQQQQIAMNPLRAMQQQQPSQAYPTTNSYNNMMVTFNPMDSRLQQSALKIQSVFRGHHVRRQTRTEALAGRMGKAALQSNNAMTKAMAKNVARSAAQLAAIENKSKQASVVSSLTQGKKMKKKMTDLEAALLVQRMYKGFKLRKALKGWIKVVDDDGDVFYKNELTNQLEWVLPSMPFNPVDEETNDADGEVDYEYDDDGNLWYLDGPGGQRLAWGWRRCEEGDDIWYTNDDEGESSWEPVYAE